MWLSTQTPHQDRDGLALILGMAPDQVRVVAPDVGGGFGGKGLDVEDVLVAWLARATGRPVRWTETRSENMVAMHHGRAQQIDFEIGGDREGTVEALRLGILQDAGAYPGLGAFLPNLTALMASGVYAIPKIEIEIKTVVTNTTPTAAGPRRGAAGGHPDARAGDRPVRRRASRWIPRRYAGATSSPPTPFPYTTASGAPYDCGNYRGALDLVLEARRLRRAARASRPQRRRDGDPRLLGIGLSAYVEVTNGIAETEFGAVEITAEGEAIVKTGSFSQGQGHETTFAQIVAAAPGPAGREDPGAQGRHRRGGAGDRHLWLQVDPDRRGRGQPGL